MKRKKGKKKVFLKQKVHRHILVSTDTMKTDRLWGEKVKQTQHKIC